MAGVLLYAGLGWLLSLWIGHRPLLIAAGMAVGLALSYYLVFSGLARDAKRDKNVDAIRGGAIDARAVPTEPDRG